MKKSIQKPNNSSVFWQLGKKMLDFYLRLISMLVGGFGTYYIVSDYCNCPTSVLLGFIVYFVIGMKCFPEIGKTYNEIKDSKRIEV